MSLLGATQNRETWNFTTELELGFEAVTEKYGAPDILVNNAGITKDADGWMAVCQQT